MPQNLEEGDGGKIKGVEETWQGRKLGRAQGALLLLFSLTPCSLFARCGVVCVTDAGWSSGPGSSFRVPIPLQNRSWTHSAARNGAFPLAPTSFQFAPEEDLGNKLPHIIALRSHLGEPNQPHHYLCDVLCASLGRVLSAAILRQQEQTLTQQQVKIIFQFSTFSPFTLHDKFVTLV
jgi:hypothetical protein